MKGLPARSDEVDRRLRGEGVAGGEHSEQRLVGDDLEAELGHADGRAQ